MAEARRLPQSALPVIAALLGVYAAAVALAPSSVAAIALAAPLLAIPLFWWSLLAPDRWIGLFFFAALLLPPLPIALGDSGPHPALLCAAIGLLAGALWVRDWAIRGDLLTISLLLYFLVLFGSVAIAALYSGASVAAASLARVLLFGISLYVFFYTAYGPGRESVVGSRQSAREPGVRALFWIGVVSALFACVDFYYQFPPPAGFGPQYVWLASGVYRRAQGVFYEASTLGNFCAFFLAMIAVALLRPKASRPLATRALVAGGVVFAAALLFSFSRASLLNVLVAGSVLLFLNRGRIRVRRWVLLALIAAIAAIAAGYLAPTIAELYWGRLRGTAEFLTSAPGTVLSGRADTWRIVGSFLLDHPLFALAGCGYKTLPYTNVLGEPVVVDNMYLSTLAETGLLGLAALLLLNFAILRASWRAARSPDLHRSFPGAWMLSFWSGQVFQMLSGDLLTYWRVLPVYLWVLALAVREP